MTLLVLGNFLLDMVAAVSPEFLKKYDLVPDSIQTVAGRENLKGIYAEVAQMENVTMAPGGSALNTVRMTQVRID